LGAAKTTLADTAIDHFGGRIYSTGIDDVKVTILDPQSRDLTPPTSVSVGIPDSIFLHRKMPFHCITINLKSAGSKRELYIGKATEFGQVVNLGKLPPGEVILDIHRGNLIFATGCATNNPDNLVHAVVRTYAVQTQISGGMQVWFEDVPGPHFGWAGSVRSFTGAAVELTGGLADNNAVADLLKVIKEQTGPGRQDAINSLKQICPRAAANAGF
jgi:hypothetical protein